MNSSNSFVGQKFDPININRLKEANKIKFSEIEMMVNEFYSLSTKNKLIKLIDSKYINNNNNKFIEFPCNINHRNFNYFIQSENEYLAIYELTINKLKENDEDLGIFYLDLKRFYLTFWQDPKESFDNFNVLKNDEKDNHNLKNHIIGLKDMFENNRYKFRRNLKHFLENNFNSESKELLVFLDTLVYAHKQYDQISKIIEEFLNYIEKNYDIELSTINVGRSKTRKK